MVMLTAKVPIKVVSQALGHSTIALTSDTYSHVLDEMQTDAAFAIDAVIAGSVARGKLEGFGGHGKVKNRVVTRFSNLAPTGFEL